MQTILIDTDIAIDFLRGSSKIKETTNNFIKICRIEPLTLEITEYAADLYQTYRKKDITLTTIDCLISSTAKVNHHKIATRNLKHYPDKSILFNAL